MRIENRAILSYCTVLQHDTHIYTHINTHRQAVASMRVVVLWCATKGITNDHRPFPAIFPYTVYLYYKLYYCLRNYVLLYIIYKTIVMINL